MSASNFRPLGEVASVTLGMTIQKHEGAPGEGVPVIYVGDIDEAAGEVTPMDQLKEGRSARPDALDRFRVRSGDLLVSCKGTIGKVGLVKEATDGAVASSNLVIVRPKEDVVHPATLFAFLTHPSTKQTLQSRARGSAIQSLSTRDLYSMEIPIPSPKIQAQIHKVLQAHLESVQATKLSLQHREAWIQGLLLEAMRG